MVKNPPIQPSSLIKRTLYCAYTLLEFLHRLSPGAGLQSLLHAADLAPANGTQDLGSKWCGSGPTSMITNILVKTSGCILHIIYIYISTYTHRVLCHILQIYPEMMLWGLEDSRACRWHVTCTTHTHGG